jgi:hypothetical protein
MVTLLRAAPPDNVLEKVMIRSTLEQRARRLQKHLPFILN